MSPTKHSPRALVVASCVSLRVWMMFVRSECDLNLITDPVDRRKPLDDTDLSLEYLVEGRFKRDDRTDDPGFLARRYVSLDDLVNLVERGVLPCGKVRAALRAQRERVAAQEEAAFEAMWERLEAPSSSESGDEGSEGSGSQDMDEDSD